MRVARYGTGAVASVLVVLGLVAVALSGCGGGSGTPTPPPPPQATAVPGVVRDADTSAAIAGARVVVGGKVGASDATGAFTVTDVPFPPAGTNAHPITVSAAGYRTFDDALLIVPGQSTQTPVTVELEFVDPDLTGTVRGHITSGGAPVSGALVRFIVAAAQSIVVQGHTDETGEYVVGGIPSGNAGASVTAAGFLTEAADTIVVADAQGTTPDLDFSLTPGTATVAVSGIVLTVETQQPVPGAEVVIDTEPAVTTGVDGRFTVPDVPVGSRPVSVTAAGFDPFTGTVEVTPDLPELRIELSILDADPPPVPFTIAGTVVVSGAPDNSGVTVTATLNQTSEELDSTTTDASGAYALWVPPGDYTVRATLGGQTASAQVTVPPLGGIVTGIDFVLAAP